jgi:hypothetical protein
LSLEQQLYGGAGHGPNRLGRGRKGRARKLRPGASSIETIATSAGARNLASLIACSAPMAAIRLLAMSGAVTPSSSSCPLPAGLPRPGSCLELPTYGHRHGLRSHL